MNLAQAQKTAFCNGYFEALGHVDDILTQMRVNEAKNQCENYTVFNDCMNELFNKIHNLKLEASEYENNGTESKA